MQPDTMTGWMTNVRLPSDDAAVCGEVRSKTWQLMWLWLWLTSRDRAKPLRSSLKGGVKWVYLATVARPLSQLMTRPCVMCNVQCAMCHVQCYMCAQVAARLLQDYDTMVVFFGWSAKQWTRLSAQVYLQLSDFEQLGQLVRSGLQASAFWLHQPLAAPTPETGLSSMAC